MRLALNHGDTSRHPVSGEGHVYGFIWAFSFLAVSLASSIVLCGRLIGWPIAPELTWGLVAAIGLLVLAGMLGLLSVPSSAGSPHRL